MTNTLIKLLFTQLPGEAGKFCVTLSVVGLRSEHGSSTICIETFVYQAVNADRLIVGLHDVVSLLNAHVY
jgi:hypothetical protein